MSQNPAFPARSGVIRCASGWDPPNGELCLRFAFPRSFSVRQLSLSERDEQGTACLHSWAHWCFTASPYFSLQVPLTVLRCVLCHFGRRLKGCFKEGSVLLHSFGVFWFCFTNNSRESYPATLIQFASSPKAPHLHRRTPQVFPELFDAENYCRNPGGENERPWCYTKDPAVTWEYCSVSPCGDGRQLQFIIADTVAVLWPCKVFASWVRQAVLCSGFS